MNGVHKKQKTKRARRKAKEQTMHTPQQFYDCTIFELAIRAFDIQSGRRNAYERQREYMRRDLFIASTHTDTLDLPSLPMEARQAHILPGLVQHSLLSVGQMCDSGCTVTFTANKVAVKHGAATILTGTRDKDSGFWRLPH
jgi:hypothetical protein